jgi:hypothetical protein
MKYHFIQASNNRKTGPIPQTYTERASCPPSCPQYRSSCYAEDFHTRLNWDKVPARGTDLDGLLTAINRLPKGQLWRHNVAGDLPGDGETIDPYALGQIVKANRGRKGFTYTHKHSPDAIQWAKHATDWGFTVNLSADDVGPRRPARRPWSPSGRYRTDGHPKAQHHTRRPPGPNLPSSDHRLHDVRTLRTMPAGRQTPDYRVSRPWHQGQASRQTRPPGNPNRRSMTAPAPALRRGLSRELSRLQEQNKC